MGKLHIGKDQYAGENGRFLREYTDKQIGKHKKAYPIDHPDYSITLSKLHEEVTGEFAKSFDVEEHFAGRRHRHDAKDIDCDLSVHGLGTKTNVAEAIKNHTLRLDGLDDEVDAHKADTANPHHTDKAQVGLGNVDNTSDADKPVSTAAQAALDAKADKQNVDGGFSGGGGNASAKEGGAIGSGAYTERGGSVGCGATTSDGFSGGYNARAYSGTKPIDAIQLGAGTNSTPKTLQVYDKQLMDAEGHIPDDRIPQLYTKADKQTVNGGFAGGQDAGASDGGAIGRGAFASSGGAAGVNATVDSGGGAVGANTRTENGGAVGRNSNSSSGGAVGDHAIADSGGAVGASAHAMDGGAVGMSAKTGNGFAGGYAAKTVNANGTAIDAIQLGTGTNNTPKTLQVYDNQLLDADGHIPSGRIPQLDSKVDKVAGKQLSANDYTTAEKSKLAGIAANANNYTHPSSHPATMITQDGTHRFATDAEKTSWNSKLAATGIIAGNHVSVTRTGSTVTINAEGAKGTAIIVGNSAAGHTADMCDFLCDGTDDQEEINGAIGMCDIKGGSVLILEGLYTISDNINLANTHDIIVCGSGASTVLKRAFSTTSIGVIDNSNVQHKITIANLTIDGTRNTYASTAHYGMHFTVPENSTGSVYIHNCNIVNCGTGIYCTGRITINGNNISGCYTGIYGGAIITNNIVSDCKGINISNSEKLVVGNLCIGGSGGIITNAANVSIVGNHISGTSGYGVCLNDFCTMSIASGNICKDNQIGILINGKKNIALGNICFRGSGVAADYGTYDSSIKLGSSSSNNVVTNNRVFGKGVTTSGTDNIVSGNEM